MLSLSPPPPPPLSLTHSLSLSLPLFRSLFAAVSGSTRAVLRRAALCPTVVSICRTVIIDCRIPRDGATLRALNTPEGPDRARCIRTFIPCRLSISLDPSIHSPYLFVSLSLAIARTYGYACMDEEAYRHAYASGFTRTFGLLDIAFSSLRRIRYQPARLTNARNVCVLRSARRRLGSNAEWLEGSLGKN